MDILGYIRSFATTSLFLAFGFGGLANAEHRDFPSVESWKSIASPLQNPGIRLLCEAGHRRAQIVTDPYQEICNELGYWNRIRSVEIYSDEAASRFFELWWYAERCRFLLENKLVCFNEKHVDILRLLAEGRSVKQISRVVDLSERQTKRQISQMRQTIKSLAEDNNVQPEELLGDVR